MSIEKTYDYHDQDGNLLFQVCRTRTQSGDKGFFQRRPVPGYPGEWAVGLAEGQYRRCSDNWWRQVASKDSSDIMIQLPQCKTVLYRLPDLLAHPDWSVIVVEGEKDAETLREVFKNKPTIATTAPMGAGKWPREFGGFLSGRRVTVCPDNDDQGLEHALRVIGSAIAYGAKSVRWIRWPGSFPEGGDVTDWLLDTLPNGTQKEKCAAVTKLILDAELWQQESKVAA